MAGKGKRYQAAVQQLEDRPYTVNEAVELLRGLPHAKFDESVELAMKLNIDPRKADQVVRGTVVLPRGTGRKVRVLVFASGDAADQASDAGADHVGAEELVQKIQQGWLEFDVALAVPAMMRHVGKLGKLLGPRGLMPSPKSGTVTDKIAQAVKEFKAGKVEFRSDDGGNVHAMVGRVSFAAEWLAENIQALFDAVRQVRPVAVKGTYIQKVVLSTTMGPGVALAL